MSDVLDRAQALEEMERAAGVLAVRSLCSAPTNPDADCIDCGFEIDPHRRAAQPAALRCLTCQEARERGRRQFCGA